VLAAALASLVLAAPAAVTVPTGRPTTLAVRPAPIVFIPAGRFVMGAEPAALKVAQDLCMAELREGGALAIEISPRCLGRFDGEAPAAEVSLPAFAIDRTEVTVAAFAACVKEGACRPAPELGLTAAGDLPVERVTWLEARAYCRARGGRLPTEAEWERAAAGAGGRVWPWGNTWLDRHASHGHAERLGPRDGPAELARPRAGDPGAEDPGDDDEDGFAGRAPVGSFPAGASVFGVLDLAGNVSEWTSDHYGREPPQSAQHFDPRGPAFANERTVRGGSYRSPPSELRVTRRLPVPPSERRPGVGFRCAYDRAPPPPAPAR
jgi:formylglycine-generating enzyme required for sulfatase activity